VPSIALITASIMSKKIAETLDALVLDVKCGSGAFLATLDRAEELAHSLIAIGKRAGVATAALITDMDQPLGKMVGNACEVDESIDILRGEGPHEVRELTLELGARILVMTGRSSDRLNALSVLADHLDSGRAMDRFEAMVRMQGGNLDRVRPVGRSHDWHAPRDGRIAGMDGQKIGEAIIAMGGGRTFAGQSIDHSVGLCFEKRLGDSVHRGDVIVRVLCDDESKAELAMQGLCHAIAIEDSVTPGMPAPLALWRDFA
jgi:thymidine phosphorylase